MKKTFIFLALMCVTLLSSCGTAQVTDTEEIATLEPNIEKIMAELTGNVVIDMNHALA